MLVLIRGLPGSGKSTLARSEIFTGFKHYEADMYFQTQYGYKYIKSKAGEAHEWCERQTYASLDKEDNVVVSNTFTRTKEMATYIQMCKSLKLPVKIIEATGSWPNTHRVPQLVAMEVRKRWEKLPVRLEKLTVTYDELRELARKVK